MNTGKGGISDQFEIYHQNLIMEGTSKKEKGLMDMGNRVVIVAGWGDQRTKW